MDWLLNRGTMIALAVGGALFSMAASALIGRLGESRAKALSRLGYACMGASMLLFVVLGLLGPS